MKHIIIGVQNPNACDGDDKEFHNLLSTKINILNTTPKNDNGIVTLESRIRILLIMESTNEDDIDE